MDKGAQKLSQIWSKKELSCLDALVRVTFGNRTSAIKHAVAEAAVKRGLLKEPNVRAD